jgi:hypothetical protein
MPGGLRRNRNPGAEEFTLSDGSALQVRRASTTETESTAAP